MQSYHGLEGQVWVHQKSSLHKDTTCKAYMLTEGEAQGKAQDQAHNISEVYLVGTHKKGYVDLPTKIEQKVGT